LVPSQPLLGYWLFGGSLSFPFQPISLDQKCVSFRQHVIDLKSHSSIGVFKHFMLNTISALAFYVLCLFCPSVLLFKPSFMLLGMF
jgi:hypothetical protein